MPRVIELNDRDVICFYCHELLDDFDRHERCGERIVPQPGLTTVICNGREYKIIHYPDGRGGVVRYEK